MPAECEFESETLTAALQGRRPRQLDAELRAHIATCGVCANVAAAVSAVETLRDETRAEAVIPDSGRVWWLAQLRARREAAETACSPITAVQVIAFAAGAGFVGACFGATSTSFQSALRWVATHPLAPAHGLLAIGMAVLLFVIPVAAWLAMGRD